jgi:dTDP-4-amino-4,6-dideoxygalactose transaminase
MIYYPVPLHLQALYLGSESTQVSLPHAEQAAQEVLSLPMYPELSSAQQDQIAAAIREFLG